MSAKRIKYRNGISLIETMIAMAIVAVAVIGALGFQYHAARHTSMAQAEITATRTAQLLLEDWKSTGGATGYDPTTLGLGFASASQYQAHYSITIDGLPMYITLANQDIASDSATGITLREISVTINWRRDHQPGLRITSDPLFTMTTYVRVDAAGG